MSEFRLFPYLRKNIPTVSRFSSSRSRTYYNLHSYLFSHYPFLSEYSSPTDGFALMKANIILRSLDNKEAIEERAAVANINPMSSKQVEDIFFRRLSYLEHTDKKSGEKRKIYVPLLSEEDNRMYSSDYKLLTKGTVKHLNNEFPARYRNPFTDFGYQIFASPFSDLIPLKENKEQGLMAFYAVEGKTVYIITKEGTLEEEIPLFSSDVSPIAALSLTHLLKRLEALATAYFNYDKDAFIDLLYNFGFISEKMYVYILKREHDEQE